MLLMGILNDPIKFSDDVIDKTPLLYPVRILSKLSLLRIGSIIVIG